MAFKYASALMALYASVASAVPRLEIQGTAFVNPNTNERFQILGMAYQPGGSAGYDPGTHRDPLSHPEECLRDAIIMQGLGVNTIRVYNLDPEVDHDECVTIFDAAGIYMLLDVNSPLPNESIHAEQPWTSYHAGYLERVFQILENFMMYDNLLGFFSANEVINDFETGAVAPQYIRAVTRDIKTYLANHAPRQIPVGYSAADVREILIDSYQYLTCQLEDDENNLSRIDFYGINSYSWCGEDATYETSGFNTMVEDLMETAVPIFFSEYGCNEVDPRTWTEVRTIYGSEMSQVFSGGIVYEYTQEENNYGLVELDDNTLTLLDDYDYLMSVMNDLNTDGFANAPSVDAGTPPACSPDIILQPSSGEAEFQTNFTIPATPSDALGWIENGEGATGGFRGTQARSYDSVSTAMPSDFTIEGSGGDEISGLELRVLSCGQSNMPGNGTTQEGECSAPAEERGALGGVPASASSPGESGGDTDAAASIRVQGGLVALSLAAVAAMLL